MPVVLVEVPAFVGSSELAARFEVFRPDSLARNVPAIYRPLNFPPIWRAAECRHQAASKTADFF